MHCLSLSNSNTPAFSSEYFEPSNDGLFPLRDPIAQIFRYLDVKTAVHLSRTCHAIHALWREQEENLWKFYCVRDFFSFSDDLECKPSTLAWKIYYQYLGVFVESPSGSWDLCSYTQESIVPIVRELILVSKTPNSMIREIRLSGFEAGGVVICYSGDLSTFSSYLLAQSDSALAGETSLISFQKKFQVLKVFCRIPQKQREFIEEVLNKRSWLRVTPLTAEQSSRLSEERGAFKQRQQSKTVSLVGGFFKIPASAFSLLPS